MDADLLAKIMQLLGQLEEGQRNSSESRGRLYAKLEKIEKDIEIVGAEAAKAMDKVSLIEDTVIKDVKPVTDEIKRLRLMGIGGAAVLAVFFTALGLNAASIASSVEGFLGRLFK